MNEVQPRLKPHSAGNAGTGLATAGATLAAAAKTRAVAPDGKIGLAVVGIHGRGQHLAKCFAARPDCDILYLCDVDQSLFPPRVQEIEQIQDHAPKTVQDFRRAIDDKSVDAIVVATPDHWHALATIWGVQAGKDVYVEKPISHSPWEGRKMVEAARRHERIVQVGTQNRSAQYNMRAKEYLDSGKLGTVRLVRVFNQKDWPNVQPVARGETPAELDWDMWNGPAPLAQYNANHHHYWNHYWNYSGGDIINDGVHQMDLARWLIGKKYPLTVYSTGGRYAQQGDFETPDTQITVFEFDNLIMTFELTLYTPYMLKSDIEMRNQDIFPHWPQNATRIEVYGSQGLLIVGRHGDGWQVFHRPHERQPVVADEMHGPFPDDVHQQNFVDSVRSRQRPNADIEDGHLSTLLCQYANISYRLGGRKLSVNPATEQFVGDDEANRLLKREYRGAWTVPDAV